MATLFLRTDVSSEAEVKRLAPMVEAKGATAMDCPVSGGCHRAATGNIAIFAGGERAAPMLPYPVHKSRRTPG